MLTKEQYKTLGIIVIGSFAGVLAALAVHQKYVSPLLVIKPAVAPKVS